MHGMFSPLIDETGIIHTQEGGSVLMGQVPDLNTGNVSNDPSNTRSITVTKVVKGTNADSSSYAQKLSLTPFTKVNLRKLDVGFPNDADYDIWLPLASFHEVSDRMRNSLYGYFIGKRLAFHVVEWFVRNNWEKYGLKKVTLVKDFFFFQFLSNEEVDSVLRDGPWMIRDDCPKAPKWVVNRVEKGKGGSSRADDEGFTKLTAEVSPKMTLSICKKNVSTSGNLLKKESKTTVSTSSNHIVSLSNSFDALNDDNLVTMEVESVSKDFKSGMNVEGKSSTPIVDKNNRIEKHLMEGKCVLMGDDGKPLEKVDYSSDHDSDDEVASVDNEMANFLAAKTLGVSYGQDIRDHIQSLADNIDIKINYDRVNELEPKVRALSTMTYKNIVEIEEKEDSVYAASLRFRLLRQHGYNVSQGTFKFKDSRGDFMGFPKTDLKGLINLYESSYLAFEGERDLHEAKLFAIKYLPDLMGQEYGAHKLINHALKLPLYHRMLILEERWYIDAYIKRKDANILMLELAALDFNMVQSKLKTDLQELSKYG
ncbi:(E)-beta-ocimene synthase, chloroplastic-like protein [Tanacetum coccineum]|uniref:(E)-beta-ocimene synthase, chloroplastic-like protein n=1 Tax=Tanacetum coccineum TaxID=301880 RepID=A0ABQ4WEY0_9ASTR